MPAWNDLVEDGASELITNEFHTWRTPFRKHGAVYPFEGAEKLEIPDIAYTGNAHRSDYHGKMNGIPLRVRFWYSSSFDEKLQEAFYAVSDLLRAQCMRRLRVHSILISPQRLRSKLHDWDRAAAGHKNISSFCGLVEAPCWSKVPSLVIPLYRMDINQYIRHTPKTNPLLLLLKVADALAFMHSLDPPVVHGAIRGGNIFIDEHGEPKLVDIGLEHLPRAYGASEDQCDRDHIRWLAPEFIDPPYEHDEHDQGVSYDSSTPETDVWSFGMTMLEVLSGKVPWAHIRRNIAVVYHLAQGELPQRPRVQAITDQIWKLMLLCFEQEPRRRITMNQVRSYLQHLLIYSNVPRIHS